MTLRETVFAVTLLACIAAVVHGVAQIHTPTGWIVGGIVGGAWSWVVFAEVGE